jgi:hypothetical protein
VKPIRFTASALFLTSFAALAQLVPGCHKQSFNDYPPGNDASSDGPDGSSSGGGGLGDDALSLGDSYPSDDSTVGSDCTLPSGTYAVTATPMADADPTCTPWSSTVKFPPSGKPDDAGVTCQYTPTGQLPLCAVSFTCQGLDEAGMPTLTTGFIEVDGTSIEGREEIQMPTGDETETTCNYTLTYAKQ